MPHNSTQFEPEEWSTQFGRALLFERSKVLHMSWPAAWHHTQLGCVRLIGTKPTGTGFAIFSRSWVTQFGGRPIALLDALHARSCTSPWPLAQGFAIISSI